MKTLLNFLLLFIGFLFCIQAIAQVKGIYITSGTLEDTSRIIQIIRQSKAAGINTFVVDVDRPSKQYEKNIQLLKQNNIRYVARIVVFPQGGTPERVKSLSYREGKFNLVKLALAYGADEIQLDYIRYDTHRAGSGQHAIDVHNVIKWFKQRINKPLQIDVFGVASFGPEKHIGQDVRLFSNTVDAICPMNYPSHFQPFEAHSARPYETILKALTALKNQLGHPRPLPVKIYGWIETSNYHYAWTAATKQRYIKEQIRAVNQANIDGWFAWSPNNLYDNLFKALTR